jgi:hypothetical protein
MALLNKSHTQTVLLAFAIKSRQQTKGGRSNAHFSLVCYPAFLGNSCLASLLPGSRNRPSDY